jgi:uncharacterized protein YxeA
MKKMLILISTLFVSIFTLYFYSFYTQNLKSYNSFNNLNVKNGDLILRRGKSVESFIVYVANQKADYTHIGIIKIEQNITYVIHIVPDLPNIVKKEVINEFCSTENSSKYTILRSTFSEQTNNAIADKANSYFKNKIQFDNNYDLNNEEQMYCTELVVCAFNSQGKKLNLKKTEFDYVLAKKDILFPKAFINSKYFKKIY